MDFLAFFNNLMGPDSLLILLVITLLFGAKRLPELAKGMGSAVREFSKAKDGVEPPPPPQIQPPSA